jgi:hypothetical protein
MIEPVPQWHCGGLGFKSPRLHHINPEINLSDQDLSVVADMWSHGQSLAQVWSDWRRLYLASDQSVKTSVELFLSHLKEADCSHRYCQEFQWVLDRLDLFMDVSLPICQIPTKSWWGSLDAMGAGNTARRKVSVFLNWCLQQGFINEVVKIPGKPSYPKGDIEILSNKDVSSLIQSCPSDLLGHIWLCLCLGLRVAEAEKVDHLSVKGNYLIVGAKAAKTQTRRVLDIPEHHGHYASLIQPQVNLKKRMLALREESEITKWPRNVMRHTAASHWLNRLQSAEAAALHLGNSPVMLHRHYKALVTKDESEEFFAIWDQHVKTAK